MKLQPKLLKLRGHNHQDTTTTKDKCTITKGIKADTLGTTETPHAPDLESQNPSGWTGPLNII